MIDPEFFLIICMTDLQISLFICIAVMLVLFGSFLLVFTISQGKKLKHQQDLQRLQETQQNQLIEAAVRSEEIERHRIAETLHDEVGAILSSSKLHLQAIKTESLDKHDQQLHEKGKELLNEGIQKVRGISHNLHSNILKEFGLNEAIRHFVNMLSKESVLKTSTELDDTYTTKNPENDISIYRMVQELVNNIMKHANAKGLRITSSFNDDGLTINMFYDGIGLSQQQFEEFRYKKEGLGLKNIQNRIILLKGSVEFFAAPQDNHIRIFIPVNTSI
jgi:two-component system NarL family sensor kinase